MSNLKKRGRTEPDETVSRKKAKSQPQSATSQHEILSALESFGQSLSMLLSSSFSQSSLSEALGEEKSNFILALQAMKDAGEMSWLPPTSASKPKSISHTEAWPPPLPQIRNQALRLQTFTHRSFILGEAASAPGVENMHYERLEFLGDSYLQSISSQILYNRFPIFREGELSEMRSNLVCNKMLGQYARKYGLEKEIREGKGQDNKTQHKIVADCFEAYIGALVLDADTVDDGVVIVRDWLTLLFEPKIKEMEQQRKTVVPVDKMAKQTLNAIAGGNKASIEYKWTDGHGGNKGGYWITVYLTGWGFQNRAIGKGWGRSKSDAELRAAMNIIANKEFCNEMKMVKEKILGPRPPPGSATREKYKEHRAAVS